MKVTNIINIYIYICIYRDSKEEEDRMDIPQNEAAGLCNENTNPLPNES